MSFQIRNLLYKEFEMVQKWAIHEGWNPGLYDYQAFKAFDNKRFWLGILDEKPIGAVATIQDDENYAFVGWFLVKKEFRKHGYGNKIMTKALQNLTAKSIGLEAASSVQNYYKKLGFVTQYMTIRRIFLGTNNKCTSLNIKKCSQIPFENLVKYDQECYPAKRKNFLEKWINFPEAQAIAYVQNDKIKGYGVLRKCIEGYRIGPLFADNLEISKQLLKFFVGAVSKQQQIFIDMPSNNKNTQKLVDFFKTKSIDFSSARMYKGQIPNIPTQKMYGVTTLQIG